MTNDEAADFCARLTALAELFNAKLSEAAQVMYFEALRDLASADLVTAMSKAAKMCKFMPKPIELREFAVGNIEELALQAWNGYKQAAKIGGSLRSLICDGVLAFALENTFGSWPDACGLELSPEMWASKRKEFTQNYRIAMLRDPDPPNRLLRGTGVIDDKWNRPLLIDLDGSVMAASIQETRDELTGGPDARVFDRLLPS